MTYEQELELRYDDYCEVINEVCGTSYPRYSFEEFCESIAEDPTF